MAIRRGGGIHHALAAQWARPTNGPKFITPDELYDLDFRTAGLDPGGPARDFPSNKP